MTHNYQSNGTMGSAFAPSLTKEDLYRASMATYGNGFGAPMSGAPNPIEIGQSTGISDVFGGMSYTACGGAMSTPQMMTQTPTLQETGNWMTYLSQEMSDPMRNMAPVYQSYDPNYLNQMTQTLRPERTWQDDLSEWMVDSNMGRAIGLGLQGGANSTFNPFGYAMRSLGIDTRPLQPRSLTEEAIEYGGSAAADTVLGSWAGRFIPKKTFRTVAKSVKNQMGQTMGQLGSNLVSFNPIIKKMSQIQMPRKIKNVFDPIWENMHFTKKGGTRLGRKLGNEFVNNIYNGIHSPYLTQAVTGGVIGGSAYAAFPDVWLERMATEQSIDKIALPAVKYLGGLIFDK